MLQPGDYVDLQISDEQVIHSHTPLLTLPSLRRKHCVVIGQGPVVDIVQEEYPFTSSTLTTPWPHFIIDVGLVQRGFSIPSPVLLKCCVASVVA